MAALTVHAGVVKFPVGRTFETQYGSRINCVIVIQDTGEEVKLWGSPGDAALTALKKGQQVALAQDQKGWKLLSVPPADDAPVTSNCNGKAIAHTPLDVEQKRAIASYIDELSSIYRYCVKQTVERQLTDIDPTLPDTEERVRGVATTLFIQTCKKFNL